jgi:hypothetical protein
MQEVGGIDVKFHELYKRLSYQVMAAMYTGLMRIILRRFVYEI